MDDDITCALMGNQLLGRLVSTTEADELIHLARTHKLGRTPYGASLLSMAQSIEAQGATQKDALLQIARTGKDEREAQFQLFNFLKPIRETLIKDVTFKGRPEGDAKRELRERLQTYLAEMYPGANIETIVLTIGQAFHDVPGSWEFNIGMIVLALRNLRRIG